MIFFSFLRRRESNTSGKPPSVEKWPDHVITLGSKDFDEFIQKYPLSLVDFWAPWCAPCRAIAPRLRRLSKIYKGQVAFGRLDTQKNQDVAKKYNVMGIPHLIFFRYGKKVMSITGVKPIGNIKNIIEDLLEKNK